MQDRLSAFRGIHILVVGDVMLDHYLWCRVNRISPEAPVPVVRVEEKTSVLGGAANVAANLAGVGCQVALLGTVGDDEAGRMLGSKLAEAYIANHLLVDSRKPTTSKTRVLAQGQQLIRLDEEDTDQVADGIAQDLLSHFERLLSGKQAVICSDYGKGLLTGRICTDIIALCRRRQVPVLIDPKGKDWGRYRGATCVTPNEPELSVVAEGFIGSEADLVREAVKLQKQFDLEQLLVTRGARGMMLIDNRSQARIIAAKPREVFDVSGAGDTVIALLAAGVAAGFGWLKAAQIANAAAGVVVGKVGTHAINLDELQVALRLDEVGSLHKIHTLTDAKMRVESWRTAGETIVFTNGCFDLLHPGHVKLLQAAAREANRLVVGLNSDASVTRLKGPERPILNQQDRASILAALECVDMVTIFDEDTPLQLIESLRPDVLVKGADYSIDRVVGREVVEGLGGKVVLVPLAAGSSTSSIVQAIQKNSLAH